MTKRTCRDCGVVKRHAKWARQCNPCTDRRVQANVRARHERRRAELDARKARVAERRNRPGKTYTIACKDCHVTVENVGASTKRCQPCANKRTALMNRIREEAARLVAGATPSRRRRYENRAKQYQAHLSITAMKRAAAHRGIQFRPSYCQRCAKDCKPHGHHFAGYEGENALKVIWLCTACHAFAHSDERNAARTA